MMTTLPTRKPNSTALTVKKGMSALRTTWAVTSRTSETPLERAVSMKFENITSITAVRMIRINSPEDTTPSAMQGSNMPRRFATGSSEYGCSPRSGASRDAARTGR